MSAHTKGPWFPAIHGGSGLIYGISGPHGPDRVNVVNWGGISRPSSASGQANARLIAAAPELLEVVELLYFRALGEIPDGRNIVDMAKAAIAKARGEA